MQRQSNAQFFKSLIKLSTGKVTVVLPLDAQARDTFLESLAVFVIHSDGEKNVIEGAITYDANSNPAGICIQVDKFSTFAVVKVARKTIQLTIGKVDATVGDKPYTLDAVPFVKSKVNRTLVPVRFVSEALGARLEWQATTRHNY